ncbi:hypothetical protein UPYG_G00041000 [Umbra pygmaea]|uniref:DUF4585 domain-containing protein n=1 Tax=Umbra pygmaea TaxID=75934 RepID=A0ABD0YE15_UMBPY
MEAAEETLPYRDDTGHYRKLLHGHKDKCNPETKYEESKYVDLDDLLYLKSEDTKHTLDVTGDNSQHTVFKTKSDTSVEVSENIVPYYEKHSKDNWTYRPVSEDPTMTSSFTELNCNADLGNDNRTELLTKNDVPSECEELQYTDMYLNSKSESDDCESIILSDHLVPDIVDDESHYITTHEIQLTELDHDVDYDSGRDNEDDNLVYTFVDYASFESNETMEGTLIVKGRSHARNNAHQRVAGCAFPSTESELCDSDKFASSDESMCRHQNGSGNMEGQMHLSIKSSSGLINESNNIREKENICYHNKHVEDRSQFFFTNTDARAEGLCDNRAQYFIPAPGRQHLATKLRRKDVNEYSSGASSSISELDDADKEVRNLTSKSFRSLACPYFDAINLSTSSESSMSEYGLGLNHWSAFVDLTYGNMSQTREENVIGHKVATATFEMKKADLKSINGMTISNKVSQPNIFALNKNTSSPKQTSPCIQNAELTCPFQPAGEIITLTKTLNFRCNVEAESSERGKRIKCSENAPVSHSKYDITHTMPAKAGYEVSYQQSDAEDSMEGTHTKSSFASSLLKNVISKKMLFEQERNMERAEIRGMPPLHSTCFHCKDQDGIRDKDSANSVYRPISDMGPGYMSNSVDELRAVDIKSDYCDHAERSDALQRFCSINEDNLDVPNDICEPTKRSLTHSENSAFKSWKDGEPEPPITYNLSERDIDESAVSSNMTKLSHLFVPSSHLLPKDKELREHVSATKVSAHNEQSASETTSSSDSGGNTVKWSKAPEIKIRLSVKEDKCNPLNIANMLTPNISYPAKTATDRVPHFTVRDIRDNKCTFQTPFHQVRDVRKLVKSSYRLVSVDNSGSKGTAAPVASELREDNTASNKDEKNTPPLSVVIKCQSVNTNSSNNQRGLVTETTKQRVENERSSTKPSPESAKQEAVSLYRTRGRPPLGFPKQPNADESEAKHKQEKMEAGERKTESKIPKQAALEKLKAAVKTMEELYVFDRNEWRRKSQAPRPIEDSHVLSLIANEEHDGADEVVGTDGSERLCTEINTDRLPKTCNFQENKGSLKMINVPFTQDTFKKKSEQIKTFSNKSVFHVGSSIKTAVSSSGSGVIDGTKPCPPSQMKYMDKNITSNTLNAPLLKTSPPKRALPDWGRYKHNPTKETTLPQTIKSVNPDSENYLTIPVESGCGGKMTPQSSSFKVHGVNPGASEPCTSDSKGLEQHFRPSKKQSSELQYADTANIYQHSLPVATQGAQHLQVFSYSPSVSLLPTTPPVEDPFQPTQRKMLLDPTTGHYYLVDTPVLPARRRLFDPESGQYVDVPMPQPLPVNSVPMSPLALSPGGAYKPTYMIYPGFLSPELAAQVMAAPQVGSQVPPPLVVEDKSGEKAHGKYTLGQVDEQECNSTESESPYYSATGGSVPASVPFTLGHHFTSLGRVVVSREKTPVISITSQRGPRIIAPPSFDGTTMSFVVEH